MHVISRRLALVGGLSSIASAALASCGGGGVSRTTGSSSLTPQSLAVAAQSPAPTAAAAGTPFMVTASTGTPIAPTSYVSANTVFSDTYGDIVTANSAYPGVLNCYTSGGTFVSQLDTTSTTAAGFPIVRATTANGTVISIPVMDPTTVPANTLVSCGDAYLYLDATNNVAYAQLGPSQWLSFAATPGSTTGTVTFEDGMSATLDIGSFASGFSNSITMGGARTTQALSWSCFFSLLLIIAALLVILAALIGVAAFLASALGPAAGGALAGAAANGGAGALAAGLSAAQIQAIGIALGTMIASSAAFVNIANAITNWAEKCLPKSTPSPILTPPPATWGSGPPSLTGLPTPTWPPALPVGASPSPCASTVVTTSSARGPLATTACATTAPTSATTTAP